MTQDQLVEVVKAKAPSVPVTLYEAKDFADAMQYAVDVTEKKRHCEMLLPKEGEQYGPLSENGFPTLLDRYIAAPGLSDEEFAVLEEKSAGTDIHLLRSGLRDYLGGFDTSVTWADALVADTVTCVVNSNREEVRLGTMVAEVSIMLVRKSTLLNKLEDANDIMLDLVNRGGASYTAFITGPSRTADIERVGALGVHGPLELHIVLLED
ncbi:lactate utilization protein [Mailhella sp.]|uniref:lactate utilization protein n=1 Tax=Mailhella sp. TaxID=1981029 RepID=UPI003AB32DAC